MCNIKANTYLKRSYNYNNSVHQNIYNPTSEALLTLPVIFPIYNELESFETKYVDNILGMITTDIQIRN